MLSLFGVDIVVVHVEAVVGLYLVNEKGSVGVDLSEGKSKHCPLGTTPQYTDQQRSESTYERTCTHTSRVMVVMGSHRNHRSVICTIVVNLPWRSHRTT